VALVGEGCRERLAEPVELDVSCPSLAENDATLKEADVLADCSLVRR